MNLKSFFTSKQARIAQGLFFLILFAGLFLRFYQYLMGRSLWEDECHLALNVMKYGYKDLLKPLDFIQGAPILFLWVVKTFTKIFGYSELALRATPFLMSVFTLPLFFFVIKNLTKSNLAAVIGFLIFSLNLALIYYSSEFKPYGVDVSIYVLMIYLSISQHSFILKYRPQILILAGCFSIVISLSAFIVLFIIGCQFILHWYQNKKIKTSDLLVMGCWLVVFGANYFLFIYKHPSTVYQQANFAYAFCPTDFLSCEFITFLRNTISDVFYGLLFKIPEQKGSGYFLLMIFAVAIADFTYRKKYTLLLFTCVPILLHLGLSALKIYPFVHRLILYLTPALIILMACGVTVIANLMIRKLHMVVGIVFILFCCYFFNIKPVKAFPHWYREIKPAITFVNDSLPKNAHVYVTDPIHAYMYYNDRGIAKNKVYKALPWDVDPPDFYELVSNETSNYVIFYTASPDYQLGYGDVIKDLEKNNLVVKHYESQGYAVSEIKPLKTDSVKPFKIIDYTGFSDNFVFGEEKIIALWAGDTVSTKPTHLPKGKFTVSLVTKGTPAAGIYPHLNIAMNGKKIGDFYTGAIYAHKPFDFDLENDTDVVFKINMDNDEMINGEDRNSFIVFLSINRR